MTDVLGWHEAEQPTELARVSSVAGIPGEATKAASLPGQTFLDWVCSFVDVYLRPSRTEPTRISKRSRRMSVVPNVGVSGFSAVQIVTPAGGTKPDPGPAPTNSQPFGLWVRRDSEFKESLLAPKYS